VKKVHFISVKQDGIVDYLLTPIRKNKAELKKRGYDIKICYKPIPKNLSCDILCLLSKVTLPWLQENNPVLSTLGPVISFLQEARKYTNKIIWFDTSDSTSVTHFELLPHIDLYLKKQLLKNKNAYQNAFYGGRIFTEFYHQNFGILDPTPFEQFHPIAKEELHKVAISWNIGLGDMYYSGTRWAYYRRFVPDHIPVNFNIPFTNPKQDKINDIFLRTSTQLSRPTIAFHRQELVKQLRHIVQQKSLTGEINGPRLSSKVFRQTMAQTKIMPSPFGWGELGLRDYEAFMYGATLLKPDMNHMETWPDIFHSGETYQSFKWDFSDLEAVILSLISNEQMRLRLATQGQHAYRESISVSGMAKFCDWFAQQIEK